MNDWSAEPASLASAAAGPRRVAVVADDETSGHGLANALSQLRERGIPGHEIDVIGSAVEVLSERRYDLVHVCAPGPAGVAALLLARAAGIPVVGSYHTDPRGHGPPPTGERPTAERPTAERPTAERPTAERPTGERPTGERPTGERPTGEWPTGHQRPLDTVLTSFYAQCRVVLSPSRWADGALRELGIPNDRIARWQGGVDRTRFSPACYGSDILPDAFNVLYVGRLSREKGLDLLADAFEVARDRDPRLHLVLAGVGPEEQRLRSRLGTAASLLGWLEGEELARVYASADLLVFPSATHTFGQVVLEAQASGLPVLAVEAGGAAELIENGRSGCLVEPEPTALASAIRGLARRAALQDRLATGGLLAVHERSWERSLGQLAAGYGRALGDVLAPQEVARAA
jgi:glycosyltransferase involved in cell wall biosynthesis